MADLQCPVCAGGLALEADGDLLRCAGGHSFDVARHGYVSLLDGRSGALRADVSTMVDARLRVHATAVLAPAVTAVTTVATDLLTREAALSPLIVDIAGGPGPYSRACLRAVPAARAVVTDLSKFCARAVVRGDPAAAAVVADVWRPMPIKSESTSLALSIFAPRNVAETARILRPDGHLVMITPQPNHLTELIEPLRMLSVAPDKAERVDAALRTDFEIVDRQNLSWTSHVGAATIADLVAMGPSAFHHDGPTISSIAESVAAAHGGTVAVTCAITLAVCRVRR